MGTIFCCDNMLDKPNLIEPYAIVTVLRVDDIDSVMIVRGNDIGLSHIPSMDGFHIVLHNESRIRVCKA